MSLRDGASAARAALRGVGRCGVAGPVHVPATGASIRAERQMEQERYILILKEQYANQIQEETYRDVKLILKSALRE